MSIRWMRRTLLTTLLLALAGCSLMGSRPRVAPTVVSPERIARLVQTVNDEWLAWGASIVSLDRADTSCLALADGSCVIVDVGCGHEQAPALCPRVNDFWTAVSSRPRHECAHTGICDWARPPWAAYHANAPWSAAFVGAMMAQAGFSETEFAREPNHAAYIVAARDGTASSYEVVPTPAAVLPGDLVCAGRSLTFLQPSDLPRLGPQGFAMHCDIVVRVDTTAREADIVGGNVQQTVAKATIPLDELGQVVFDPRAVRKWAFVMRARRTLGPAVPV